MPILTSYIILYLAFALWVLGALILKGFAMYRAAIKESKGWFWVLFLFSTMGILPLIYLLSTKGVK